MQLNTIPRLPADTFLSLIQVFKKHGWEIPAEDAGYENRFNRFCQRLSLLDADEQDLVIELTRNFTVISGNDYLQFLIGLLNRINEDQVELFKKTNKFFVFPLLAPQDFKRIKSSTCVWYSFRSESIKYSPVFLEKDLIFCDITKASWVDNIKPNQAVILLDDYIGSGETAISAIEWFMKCHNVPSKQIVIISIAAQEIGIQQVQDKMGVAVFSSLHFKRGISDYYVGEQLDTYTRIMTRIENKLNVADKDRFGYNQSEALISLIRTPNNTFPVFWKTYGKNKIVPFPRD